MSSLISAAGKTNRAYSAPLPFFLFPLPFWWCLREGSKRPPLKIRLWATTIDFPQKKNSAIGKILNRREGVQNVFPFPKGSDVSGSRFYRHACKQDAMSRKGGEEGERNYIFLGLFLRGKPCAWHNIPFPPSKEAKNIFVIVSRSYLRTVSWPTGWSPSSAPD